MSDYDKEAIVIATTAIRKGHSDPENLREILIWGTAKATLPLVEDYFAAHFHDKALLGSLVEIALEGDDAGDAPWVAANVIATFPAELLAEHRPALEELAAHPWSYLHDPAKAALAKLAGHAA